MLTNRYGLGTINEALAGMSAGNEIKPLVLPWGDA
jgi:Zn-dependent alcohol dehydrogenase